MNMETLNIQTHQAAHIQYATVTPSVRAHDVSDQFTAIYRKKKCSEYAQSEFINIYSALFHVHWMTVNNLSFLFFIFIFLHCELFGRKKGDSGSGGGWKQLVMSATWNKIANISSWWAIDLVVTAHCIDLLDVCTGVCNINWLNNYQHNWIHSTSVMYKARHLYMSCLILQHAINCSLLMSHLLILYK